MYMVILEYVIHIQRLQHLEAQQFLVIFMR